jgi:hypothetical protein
MAAKKHNHKSNNFATQEERPNLRRKWPTHNDLLAWWIKYKIATACLDDVEDADIIKGWLLEFQRLTDMGVHVELYGFCQDFRIEFKSPRDYSGGAGVGIGRTSG